MPSKKSSQNSFKKSSKKAHQTNDSFQNSKVNIMALSGRKCSKQDMMDALNEFFDGLWIAPIIHEVKNPSPWWDTEKTVFSPLVGGSDIREKLIKEEYIVIKHEKTGNSFVILCNTSEGAKYKIEDRDFFEDLESFKESPDYLSLVNSDVDGHADVEELPVKVQPPVPPKEEFPSLPVQETSVKTELQAAEEEKVPKHGVFQLFIGNQPGKCFLTFEDAQAVKEESVALYAPAHEMSGIKPVPVQIHRLVPVSSVDSKKTERYSAYQLFIGGKPGKNFLSMEDAQAAKEKSLARYAEAHEESGIEPVPLDICGLVRGPVVG